MFKLYVTQNKIGLTFLQDGIKKSSALNEVYDSSFFISQLSTWCNFFKNYDLAYESAQKNYDNIKRYITNNFPDLVEWQRELLWNPLHSNMLNIIPIATETNSPSILKLAYNSLLLGKGMLLRTSNHLSNIIYQSGDSELREIHKQIKLEKDRLLKVDNQEELVSIRNNIDRLQRLELNKLSHHAFLKQMTDVDWTDLRDKLGDDDVAIEFVSYPTQDCNSYIALVINKKSTVPLCIPLFNDKELAKHSIDNDTEYDYESYDLYKIVWERLEQYSLKNIKNIYFSPDGILQKLAIESLRDNNGKLASDKWTLHRLTTTREILKDNSMHKYKSAVLYGGLKYSISSKDILEKSHIRAGVSNDIWEQTKVEVDEIKKIIAKLNIECNVLSDKSDRIGTEESFKALSGSGVNILHVATHGFFWTNETKKEYENLRFRFLIEHIGKNESALLRSGLMFSGANAALKGRYYDGGIEDGVVTAQEISSLDFHDLDLVVLSACQTGLGEISAEGVFGLQRGFKLAGAKSIVMSLWRVDDTASRMLMVEFYKHLMAGESKVEALKKAQEFVRSQKNYENPEYWAGFILLDGLD